LVAVEQNKPVIDNPSYAINNSDDALVALADISNKLANSAVQIGSGSIAANAKKSQEIRSIRQEKIEEQAKAMQKAESKAHKLGFLGKVFNFVGAITGIGNVIGGSALVGLGGLSMFIPGMQFAGALMMMGGVCMASGGAMMATHSGYQAVGNAIDPKLTAKFMDMTNPLTQALKLAGVDAEKASLVGNLAQQLTVGATAGFMMGLGGPLGMVTGIGGSVAKGGIMVGKAAVNIEIAGLQHKAEKKKISAQELAHVLQMLQMQDKEMTAFMKAHYEHQNTTLSAISDALKESGDTSIRVAQNI
jgi:hypothetical protein